MSLKGKARAPIKALPTRDELLELFDYDPETGVILWRARVEVSRSDIGFNNNVGGKVAGSIRKGRSRYLAIGIRPEVNGKVIYYMSHRLIWKMMTGEDPPEFIDHRDGDTLNNRWENLRPADNGKNLQNAKLRCDNATGVKGVHLVVKGNYRRFRAVISVNKQNHRLGNFKTLGEAEATIKAAREKLHGEFARNS